MFWLSVTIVPSRVWVKTGSYLCATFFQVLQTIQCACVVLFAFSMPSCICRIYLI